MIEMDFERDGRFICIGIWSFHYIYTVGNYKYSNDTTFPTNDTAKCEMENDVLLRVLQGFNVGQTVEPKSYGISGTVYGWDLNVINSHVMFQTFDLNTFKGMWAHVSQFNPQNGYIIFLSDEKIDY